VFGSLVACSTTITLRTLALNRAGVLRLLAAHDMHFALIYAANMFLSAGRLFAARPFT
jgi:hypothetical protein